LGSPTYALLLTAIFNNSSMSEREQMVQAIQQQMQPDPQAQQMQQMVQQLTLMKAEMEIKELERSINVNLSQVDYTENEISEITSKYINRAKKMREVKDKSESIGVVSLKLKKD